jgi:hypothetical protein
VTLKLELFDANGNRVSGAGPAPAFRFDLPIPGGSGSGVAPAETLDADGSLVFDILVDNNPTVAQLPGVHVAGSGSDPCGMIFYKESSDEVSVDFAARHPNNFLTWDLRLYRGFGGGKVVASATGAGSSANPDHFLKPASAILCPECPQAAFAATLYSSALATNGYGRQSGYDRAVTIAFGLLKRSAPGT